MKKRIFILVLGLFAAGLLFGGFSVLAQDREELKLLMYDNYAKVTDILTNLLLDHNYEEILESAELIASHAEHLQTLNPEKTMQDRKTFQSYATQLKGHVENLAIIIRYIQKENKAEGESNTFLRPVAASHFGHVVTMCVSCHNQLRK